MEGQTESKSCVGSKGDNKKISFWKNLKVRVNWCSRYLHSRVESVYCRVWPYQSLSVAMVYGHFLAFQLYSTHACNPGKIE